MARRADSSQARTELANVEREIRQLVDASKSGVSAIAIKDELLALELREGELKRKVAEPEARRLLHASVSDLYRQRVSGLRHALEGDERSLAGARDAIGT